MPPGMPRQILEFVRLKRGNGEKRGFIRFAHGSALCSLPPESGLKGSGSGERFAIPFLPFYSPKHASLKKKGRCVVVKHAAEEFSL